MLNVFVTVDVEIWCDGWNNIDKKFPHAFQQYIHGKTERGNFGLLHQAQILKERELKGVFFVEPLFSTRFGSEPLGEIVNILNTTQQEVQLHLHTEWVDESRTPLLPNVTRKRQYLRDFTQEEQTILIGTGLNLLHSAGAKPVNAFRAGSFGFNKDTLLALAANGITFDSSYNLTQFGPESGVMPGRALLTPIECYGVHEYPMTVFKDGFGKLRHAQITACSHFEFETLLWRALESGYTSLVILSHNFELLNQTKNKPDWIAVKRFEKLCNFLDRNRDCFSVCGFHGLIPQASCQPQDPISIPFWQTTERLIEQTFRRVYQ